jgi:hypothetical protein
MTTLLDRPKARSASATALSGLLPQVNLLPPEVYAARNLRKTKRWLLIGLAGVVGACITVWGLSLVSAATAASDLVTAQEDTARLQLEAEKYKDVPIVLGQLDDVRTSLELGMSTDVQWKSYVDAVAAVLPAEASIDNYAVTFATPMIGAAVPADPLVKPGLGQLAFSSRAVTVPDTAAWVDALNSVPGFSGAWVSSSILSEDEHGVYYTVSATVQLSDEVLSHRFDAAALAPTDGKG